MSFEPILLCDQSDEAKWLACRNDGIGASESASACGMSKYTQPLMFYLRKRGEIPREDENYAMLFGKIFESAIIELYGRANDVEILHPMGLYQHPVYEFLLATPDGYLPEREEGIEIKTMEPSIYKQVKEIGLAEAVPDYFFQCQHQLAVMGWKKVRLIALVGKKLHEWLVERDERFIKLIINSCKEMWDRIQNGNPPPVDYTADNSLELIKVLHPSILPGVIELGDDFMVLQEEYKELSKEAAVIEKRQKSIRAMQLAAVGDYEGGVFSNGQMLRRKIIEKAGYTVQPKEQLDVRVVNYDRTPIVGKVESYE